MPRRRIKQKKTKKPKNKFIKLLAVLLITAIAAIIIVSRLGWDRKENIAIAYPSGQSVVVSVLVPRSNEIYNIIIPSDTEVASARNLGEWKLGSVWQLGYNEKLKGKLLAETVTKNFYFPTIYWAGEKVSNTLNDGFFQGIVSLIIPFDTNLSFGDKLNIFIFSQKVPENKYIDINLEESSAIKKTTLTDGSSGYVIERKPEQSLLSLFNNAEIVENARIVQIKDGTGSMNYIENLTQLMWVLGANVTSIVPGDDVKECTVESEKKEASEKVAQLLNCKAIRKEKGEYDLIISLPADHLNVF